MNDLTTHAYAAGLIDGEGCISVARYLNKTGATFAARIDVGMSSKAMPSLEWMKLHFGGTIRKTRSRSERWESAHAWMVQGKRAAEFLPLILPYLVLKADQARLALRLQEIAAEGWTPENRRRGETIRSAMQDLNRKGPSSDAGDGWFARLVGDAWVTSQRSLFDDLGWESFCGSWPRSGLMRAGRAYRLPPLVPRISATGSSSSGYSIPTPTANPEAPNLNANTKGPRSLLEYVKQKEATRYPTPSATDWKGSSSPGQRRGQLSEAIEPTANATNGELTPRLTLNPAWVEWLQGFPIGWTDLRGSETASSPRSPSSSDDA